MREVHRAWMAACRPRAVVGPPGCGKTHAGAHAVSMQLSSGTPAIFVAARFVDLSQGLPRILQEVLDRPGWSATTPGWAKALAVLSQCTDEATNNLPPSSAHYWCSMDLRNLSDGNSGSHLWPTWLWSASGVPVSVSYLPCGLRLLAV